MLALGAAMTFAAAGITSIDSAYAGGDGRSYVGGNFKASTQARTTSGSVKSVTGGLATPGAINWSAQTGSRINKADAAED